MLLIFGNYYTYLKELAFKLYIEQVTDKTYVITENYKKCLKYVENLGITGAAKYCYNLRTTWSILSK